MHREDSEYEEVEAGFDALDRPIADEPDLMIDEDMWAKAWYRTHYEDKSAEEVILGEPAQVVDRAKLAMEAYTVIRALLSQIEHDAIIDPKRDVRAAVTATANIRDDLPMVVVDGQELNHQSNRVGLRLFCIEALNDLGWAEKYILADTHLLAVPFLQRAEVSLGYAVRATR